MAPWRFCVLSLSRRYFHVTPRRPQPVVRGAPTLDPAVGDVTVRNVTVSATPRVAVPGGPQRAGSVSVTDPHCWSRKVVGSRFTLTGATRRTVSSMRAQISLFVLKTVECRKYKTVGFYILYLHCTPLFDSGLMEVQHRIQAVELREPVEPPPGGPCGAEVECLPLGEHQRPIVKLAHPVKHPVARK